MKVIFVPRSAGRRRNISLSPAQLLVLMTLVLIGLPVLIGMVSYKIAGTLDPGVGTRDPEYVQRQAALLASERQSIEQARRDAELHLNAMAQRLGHMQAELLRLNALGQRLARMANLDKREFDFSTGPAMGGPEITRGLPSITVPNFITQMERVSGQISSKVERMNALETAMLDKQVNVLVTPSGWPVDGGWMSSGYGVRADPFTGHQSHHEGVDIAASHGSPIYAMGEGVVTFSGNKPGYGLTVEVTHKSGLVTRYAHASAVHVAVGDRVKKGARVASVGTSGRATGPHLHFEVQLNQRAVNPASFLRDPRRN